MTFNDEGMEVNSMGEVVKRDYREDTPVRFRGIIDTIRAGKKDEAVHMLLETIAENTDEDEEIRNLLKVMGQNGYIGNDIFSQAINAGYTTSQLELLGEFLGASPEIAQAEKRMHEEAIKLKKGIGCALGLTAVMVIAASYFFRSCSSENPKEMNHQPPTPEYSIKKI